MFKKLLLAAVSFIATMGFAFAQVDINKADAAALEGVKGVGPNMSKTILDERKKGGNFKDWADFETRVKGIGDKSSVKLSQAGLTVDGQSRPNTPAVAAKGARKDGQAYAKAEAKVVKKEVKKEEAKK
ncbi:MAG: helix-hairpin-helix domain-containing protein [Pseudomonadota bacterium]